MRGRLTHHLAQNTPGVNWPQAKRGQAPDGGRDSARPLAMPQAAQTGYHR